MGINQLYYLYLEFQLPVTQDLFNSLLYPLNPPTLFEWLPLASLLIHTTFLLLLNPPRTTFIVLFLFWRLAYHLGLGLLLSNQSSSFFIVRLARRFGFGQNPGRRRGTWAELVVKEMKTKLGVSDEEFDVSLFLQLNEHRYIGKNYIASPPFTFVMFSFTFFPPVIAFRIYILDAFSMSR